jgi:NAD(P)H-nitrite reductase large subunit
MNARKTEKGHFVPVYKISKKIKTQRRDDAKFLLLEVYFNPSLFEENDIVCRHLQLTKADIVKAIREKNLTTCEEIQDETYAATVCGSCVANVEAILEEKLRKRGSGER